MKVTLMLVVLGVVLSVISATPRRGEGGAGSSEEKGVSSGDGDFMSGSQRRGDKRRGGNKQGSSEEQGGSGAQDPAVGANDYPTDVDLSGAGVAAQKGKAGTKVHAAKSQKKKHSAKKVSKPSKAAKTHAPKQETASTSG